MCRGEEPTRGPGACSNGEARGRRPSHRTSFEIPDPSGSSTGRSEQRSATGVHLRADRRREVAHERKGYPLVDGPKAANLPGPARCRRLSQRSRKTMGRPLRSGSGVGDSFTREVRLGLEPPFDRREKLDEQDPHGSFPQAEWRVSVETSPARRESVSTPTQNLGHEYGPGKFARCEFALRGGTDVVTAREHPRSGASCAGRISRGQRTRRGKGSQPPS
jgi:hypothetical protein